MREIQFRAKLKHEDLFVYGYYYYNIRTDQHCIRSESHQSWSIRPETLGQFTGISDIRKQKIYEGDTIKTIITIDGYDPNIFYNNVEFLEASFQLIDPDPNRSPTVLAEYVFHTMEVVGNIHE